MKRARRFFTGAIFVAAISGLWAVDVQSRRLTYPPQSPEAAPEPTQKQRPDIVLLSRPADAVPLALADLAQIPVYDRCYFRYLWVQDGSKDAMRVASLALNYISRGSVIKQPVPVANFHLLRVDLRNYAPRDQDLSEWTQTWEELQFDPCFSLLITKDSIDFAERLAEVAPVVTVTPAVVVPSRKEIRVVEHPGGRYVYPDDSGRVHSDLPAGRYTVDLEFRGRTKAAATRTQAPAVDVLRQNAPHLPGSIQQLQRETHSTAPIVEHRYFLTRALSTIQDKGVFKQVWGGLYYQFRGIKKSTIKGATDLDVFFDTLGIGNIRAGFKQEQLFEQLRSDQRLAVFRSDITGKPREVSSFHTPADREGGSWGAITGDIKDADVDVGDRAFANLLSPRRQAREAIFPTRTGLSVFALFNGQGELQDEVPPDVAVDSTIPAPYTRRLQPAIGCLRCHGIDGSDGWKPLTNDVARLMAGKLDIFGDLSRGRKAFDPDTIDRLAGLYSGDFRKALQRARDDVAEVTLRATGSFRADETQADVAKVAAQALSRIYAEYNYSLVTAQVALRECGIDAVPAKAVDVFRQLVDLPAPQPGIYLEKPTIAALAAGIGVLRSDFSLIQAEVQSRVQANLGKVKP